MSRGNGRLQNEILGELARRGGEVMLADLDYNDRSEARLRWRAAKALAAAGLVRLDYRRRPGQKRLLVVISANSRGE